MISATISYMMSVYSNKFRSKAKVPVPEPSRKLIGLEMSENDNLLRLYHNTEERHPQLLISGAWNSLWRKERKLIRPWCCVCWCIFFFDYSLVFEQYGLLSRKSYAKNNTTDSRTCDTREHQNRVVKFLDSEDEGITILRKWRIRLSPSDYVTTCRQIFRFPAQATNCFLLSKTSRQTPSPNQPST